VSCAKGRLAESLTYEAIQRPRGWSPLMPFGSGLTFFGFSFFFSGYSKVRTLCSAHPEGALGGLC